MSIHMPHAKLTSLGLLTLQSGQMTKKRTSFKSHFVLVHRGSSVSRELIPQVVTQSPTTCNCNTANGQHRPTSGSRHIAHPWPQALDICPEGRRYLRSGQNRSVRSQARLRARLQVDRRCVAALIAKRSGATDFWCVPCSPLNLDSSLPKPCLETWP